MGFGVGFKPEGGSHVNGSFNQFSFLDLWHRGIASLKLWAGEAIATLKGRQLILLEGQPGMLGIYHDQAEKGVLSLYMANFGCVLLDNDSSKRSNNLIRLRVPGRLPQIGWAMPTLNT
jgi:hypothetical protein